MKTHEIATFVAEFLEDLETEDQMEGAHPEGSEVGVIAVVVELTGAEETMIRYRCSDTRRWLQTGLFEAAKRAVETTEYQDEEDE
jgi:hypothetical protein